MITAQNLSRNYGNFVAVDGVSFQIAKGSIVGLLGHNGAGKTTIMKMLTGYLEPSAGDVQIDGINVAENRVAVQHKIGYLPENSPIYPEMTVCEYLEYVAELRDIPEEKRRSAIVQAISRTQLTEKATEQISKLSRGYKQRVGVAQAVLHEPEILVLDEPTNGLDPAQIIEMRKLIQDLSAHSTVILSTHILQEVNAICDRVLIISRGKLVLDSSLADLSAANAILLESDKNSKEVEALIGSASFVKNVIPATSNGGHRYLTKIEISAGSVSDDASADISKMLIERGGRLFSLRKEEKSLESVFREVSH
ncbi:MAG: ATP-binding cassette domain-containing protein [Bdellovibrionales bacterium]|nr:ATP-binding cassette domain-containing protein [Bdellovibrionales bacterium]